MKVLFDHDIFYQRYGGASKYFVMMSKNLPNGMWSSTALFSSNEYVRHYNLFRNYPHIFRGQEFFFKKINMPYTRHILKTGKFNVYHQTDFSVNNLDVLKGLPMVTTYHDSNLSTFDPHPEIVQRQRISLERADAIITISKNTKMDLLNFFNIDEDKIHVIYHGIEKTNVDNVPSERVIDAPYILYVGWRWKYKNFNRFIEAFSHFHGRFPDIKVVCTFPKFTHEELIFFANNNIHNNIVAIEADELTMKKLYRDALFFIYPSLYEGFGMPILEAWSCNCPVVLSEASCFPEIAGDAGLYFDPYSVEDIYEKMKIVILDETIRKELISKGSERIKSFSWEQCAKQHWEVYKSLL